MNKILYWSRNWQEIMLGGIRVVAAFCLLGAEVSVRADSNVDSGPSLGPKSASSAQQANAIVGKMRLMLGEFSADGFKVNANAGEKSTWVYVWGVNDADIWSKVEKRLVEEKRRHGWRMIYVQFLEKEVWEDLGNGSVRRGKERVLKTFLLEK